MTDEASRLEVVVRGRVQGVGYRVFAAHAAERHGVNGWVSNQAGGSVRAVGEAGEAELRAWLEELRRGPVAGFVTEVIEQWGPAMGGFSSFEIHSGWHAGD